MQTCDILSSSPAATTAFGHRMGAVLEPGSVIALTGELGCGKTLLTRGICAGLGVPLRQVNSPTFVLVNEYRGRLPVFHLDVYRLNSEADVVDIGILDYLSRTGSGVMIVEWAEKIAGVLPDDRLNIEITTLSARRRSLNFSTNGERFATLMKELDCS
ncbi:MAG: tRNA (adenosine(37)-N6)-threonylcarbamoyltransferase complex ATPase subunit type 1 TsaE [Dehalococcoidales bacterium]|nr:tRNA (adenosine(37)-N6)-threonylcarbamoyltransferase complex ATPase subunit type 1 TsaE [Dehalococcoidales bacterium]